MTKKQALALLDAAGYIGNTVGEQVLTVLDKAGLFEPEPVDDEEAIFRDLVVTLEEAGSRTPETHAREYIERIRALEKA